MIGRWLFVALVSLLAVSCDQQKLSSTMQHETERFEQTYDSVLRVISSSGVEMVASFDTITRLLNDSRARFEVVDAEKVNKDSILNRCLVIEDKMGRVTKSYNETLKGLEREKEIYQTWLEKLETGEITEEAATPVLNDMFVQVGGFTRNSEGWSKMVQELKIQAMTICKTMDGYSSAYR
jgi:hypothetical protein